MATLPNQALSIEYAKQWLNWCVNSGYLPLAIKWEPNKPKTGKEPIGSEWQKYTMEKAVATFNWACQTETSLNVAIMTGPRSKMVVIDCDLIKPEDVVDKDGQPVKVPRISGVAYWDQHIQPRLTAEGIRPVVVRTGSGGFHHWFKWTESIAHLKNASGINLVDGGVKKRVKIDFKSDKGYVVTAPSCHYSGGQYELVDATSLSALPEIPAWLIAFLGKTVSTARPAPRPRVVPVTTPTVPPARLAPNAQKVFDLIELIDPDCSHDWEECTGMIWAITRACGDGPENREAARDLAHHFSRKSNKYDAGWVDGIVNDTDRRDAGFGIGHLIERAREYNPQGLALWEAKYPFVPDTPTRFVPLAGAEPVAWTPGQPVPVALTQARAATNDGDDEVHLPEEIADYFIQASLNQGVRRFAFVDKTWYCWDDSKILWQAPEDDSTTASYMSTFLAEALAPTGMKRRQIRNYASIKNIRSELMPFLRRKLDLSHLPLPPLWELPVKRGRVWGLTNDQVRDRTNEDYYTFECPVDPDAVTESGLARVKTFFQQISYGNWDVDANGKVLTTTEQFQKWLTNHLLYCLSGQLDKRRPNLINIYGQTRNGKTTTVETIGTILGDFSGPLARAVLFDPPQEIRGHQAHMFTLKDKRCVVLSEPGDQAGNPSTIKQALGGDQISARNCNGKQTIKFRSFAKILIPSNELFNVDSGPAMTDVKIVYVEFKAFFTANPTKPHEFKEDPTLEAWLESEEGKACFVKYLISQYSAELLPLPASVKAFHNEVVGMSRPSADVFIETFLYPSVGSRTGTVGRDQCFADYSDWCMAKKLKRSGVKDFGMKLKARFGETFHTEHGNRYEAHLNAELFAAAVPQRPTFTR